MNILACQLSSSLMAHPRMCTVWLSALLLGLLSSGTSFAGDTATYGEAHTSFSQFLGVLSGHINTILAAGSPASQFVEALFLTAVSIRLIIALSKWVLDTSALADFLAVIMVIAIVRILMDQYQFITTSLFAWAGDFASVIQLPIVGNADAFFVVDYIIKINSSITWEDASIWDGFRIALGSAILSGFVLVLNLVAFFGMTWAVWGFAIAQLIGWMFVPLLLFERTSFIFDGWVRFFVGFLVYTVIVRVNLVLTLLLLTTFYGLPINGGTAPDSVFVVNSADLAQHGGLLALILIAILSIISTGKFATAIAGGVGGFGDAIVTITRTASRFARRI